MKEELDDQVEGVDPKAGEEGGSHPHLDIESWPAGCGEDCLKIAGRRTQGCGSSGSRCDGGQHSVASQS